MAELKTAVKSELESYRAGKTDSDYREAQVAELNAALTAGMEKIDAAADEASVASAAEAAKKALDAVKTDAQLTEEEATEAPTEAPTETETDPETESPTEEATEVPAETTAEETTAPVAETTAAPVAETTVPAEGDTEIAKNGCGSVLGMGALWVSALLSAAWVMSRKQKQA